MSSNRFSIFPARYPGALSEAERIDSVLRGETVPQGHEVLAREEDLASRMDARVASAERETEPVGCRKDPVRASDAEEDHDVPESGVAERSAEAMDAEPKDGVTLVDELEPEA